MQKLTVISLFTGIGGLDYGFEAAGFRTAVALEVDDHACDVLRLNRRWPLMHGDIGSFSSRDILAAGGLRTGEADILVGGPPCQPFSKAGNWMLRDERQMRDPRAGTLREYLRILDEARPKAFLLENVPGLAFGRQNAGLHYLLGGIEALNKRRGTSYSVSIHLVNAADYGVPQLRERLFLVGFRDGRKFETPRPTHAATSGITSTLPPYLTAWDAIGDLDNLPNQDLAPTGKWSDLLPSIPEGQNYLWHTRRGGGTSLFGWRTRYWNFLLKLAKCKPSWTISAQPGPASGPFHWKSRRLSIRELCRLQTIPDTLRMRCSIHTAQRLIGNAVPALLAEAFASAIRAELLGTSSNRRMLLRLTPRATIPTAEVAARVPKKYLHLEGRHADHPGQGLGRGALRSQSGISIS